MNPLAPNLVFAAGVLPSIRRHAGSSLKGEICGILLGEHGAGNIRVTASIPGEGADCGPAHVTFTQEAWTHIHAVRDAQFPEFAVVGWYHSHPGFGIFLSDQDLFIHKNFFAAPHQIAWVVDPHSWEEGGFGWAEEAIVPIGSIVSERTVSTAQVGGEESGSDQEQSVDEVEETGEAAPAAETAPPRKARKLILGCLLVLLLAEVVWLALILLRMKQEHPRESPPFAPGGTETTVPHARGHGLRQGAFEDEGVSSAPRQSGASMQPGSPAEASRAQQGTAPEQNPDLSPSSPAPIPPQPAEFGPNDSGPPDPNPTQQPEPEQESTPATPSGAEPSTSTPPTQQPP